MNKPIYLGLSILEINKILMYEFWYDYMKPKYNDNVRLCYMDTDSFVMNIKTNDCYKDIAHDVYNRFDTSNYGVNRSLPIGKNKKVIGLMKDEWPFRMLIIGPSGSRKTNALLCLIEKFHPIDKIYLYAKDTDEQSINI